MATNPMLVIELTFAKVQRTSSGQFMDYPGRISVALRAACKIGEAAVSDVFSGTRSFIMRRGEFTLLPTIADYRKGSTALEVSSDAKQIASLKVEDTRSIQKGLLTFASELKDFRNHADSFIQLAIPLGSIVGPQLSAEVENSWSHL